MRNVLVTVVAICLLAAPSLGVINIKLVADRTVLGPGQTTTVHMLGQGTVAGLYALGGNIVASGDSGWLAADPGSFVWMPDFDPVPVGNRIPRVGSPGSDGGWSSFGSSQTDHWHPNPNYARTEYVELASYTVTAQPGPGSVTLTFSSAWVHGFLPIEANKDQVMGTITPVTITANPEPATLGLLALAGLLVGQRRRR